MATERTAIRIRIVATTDTPDMEVEGLIVGVREAAEEVHVPRPDRVLGIRRRRPIEVRLDAGKDAHQDKGRRQRRVSDTREFDHRG